MASIMAHSYNPENFRTRCIILAMLTSAAIFVTQSSTSVCPIGTEHRDCSWNLSCSDVTGVRRCKDESPCTSGCFCSNETILKDGVCSSLSSCSVCPMGMAYHQCSWNLSCSDITGVRRCKDQSPCTSGCFCSDGTVLKDGVCSNTSSCSACPVGTEYHDCSWNLSCSDITGVRRCKDQSPCTSGCFCSNETVLKDGVCSSLSSCSVCLMGMAYHQCSWNLSCSDITGVRGCKDQSPCTSGCFCSDGTVLKDGMCSNTSSCSACPVGTEYHDCSWNLSCSNITGVRRCKNQSPCMSGCFCSNQSVLIDGMCFNTNSCLDTSIVIDVTPSQSTVVASSVPITSTLSAFTTSTMLASLSITLSTSVSITLLSHSSANILLSSMLKMSDTTTDIIIATTEVAATPVTSSVPITSTLSASTTSTMLASLSITLSTSVSITLSSHSSANILLSSMLKMSDTMTDTIIATTEVAATPVASSVPITSALSASTTSTMLASLSITLSTSMSTTLSSHSSANVLLSSMLKVSDTMTDTIIATTEVAATPDMASSSDSSSVSAATIGGAVGGTALLIIIVVLLAVICYIKLSKKNKDNKRSHLMNKVELLNKESDTTTVYDNNNTGDVDIAMNTINLQTINSTSTINTLSPLERTFTQSSEASISVNNEWKKALATCLIDYNTLIIKETIAQGNFGVVYKGHYSKDGVTVEVAIKTMKDVSMSTAKEFIDECILASKFNHPNVLNIIGVSIIPEEETPLMVMPFMLNGSVQSYIKSKRGNTIKLSHFPEGLDHQTLMQMCLDIALGMEYLSSRHFVHRDLAARNCMLDQKMTVKVADFGLARDMYTESYYTVQNKKNPLPVKWLAPEALLDRKFTEKTDVWAFGITCWEVFSLGLHPYPSITTSEICDHVTNGGVPVKPFLSSDEMYKIMKSCWNFSPEERPTFTALVQDMSQQLGILDKELYLCVN